MPLLAHELERVRIISGLYQDAASSWITDDIIQVMADEVGALDPDGVYLPERRYILAIELLFVAIARGSSRSEDHHAQILRIRQRLSATTPPAGGGGGGLTILQIVNDLLDRDLWPTEAEFQRLVQMVAAIRSVSDPAGHAAGEVLTVLANGGYDWGTIGEAQIAAAVAQYLIDNPIEGVTPAQLRAAVALRVAAEEALGTRIDDEATDRTSADTALGGRIDALGRTVSSNTTAIAKNLTDLSTERGRINTLNDLVRASQGSIGIAPNAIPRVAAAQRDYTMSYEDLDDAWLRSKGTNEMEVWLKNTPFHAIDPWSPTADGTFTVNINETEARAIALSGADRIIPVRLVWRANGQFVALRNTWLELMPAAGVSELAEELKAEVTARASGDELQPETITGAAGFVSFLADQEMSAETSIAHFTIAVAEDYKGVRHTYKVGDLVWFAPMSVDGKVFANIAAAPVPELPTADKIEMLNLRVDPGVIAYPAGGLAAALTRTVRVLVDNPARLDTADLFVQGTIDGQAVLARRAWATTTVSLPFTIPVATARLIGQDEELDIVLQWYDAANAGNLVGSRRVDLPLVEQTALLEYANQAAAAAATVDANAIQWWPAS